MQILELKTKNGRTFRVAIENANQEKRLNNILDKHNNQKPYEQFISKKVVEKGVHNIADFESLVTTLV